MPKERQAEPHISWSHSRDQLLRECERRYYYRYYASRGGWKHNSSRLARRAYRLTQLTSFDQVLGLSVHNRAREIGTAVATGSPRPSFDVLWQRTRSDLNRLFTDSADLAAFEREPKHHPVLFSVYYGRPVEAETIERIRGKAESCLRHLHESAVWDDVANCPRESVWIFDGPVSFMVDQIPVWAAPDLVYQLPGMRPVILDWKTGSVKIQQAYEQLGVYGCFAESALGLPAAPEGYEGQIAELATGECWSIDLNASDLRATEDRIRARSIEMESFEEPDQPGVAKPLDAFQLVQSRTRCLTCNYLELCQGEASATRRVTSGEASGRRRPQISGSPTTTTPQPGGTPAARVLPSCRST